jgi:hypothetical protein
MTQKQGGSRGLAVVQAQITQDMSLAKTPLVSTRFDYTLLPQSTGTEVYTYKKPGNMAEMVQALRQEVAGMGGQFTGNEQQGTFSASGLSGNYRVQGSAVVFTIIEQRTKSTQPSTRGAGQEWVYVFIQQTQGHFRRGQ